MCVFLSSFCDRSSRYDPKLAARGRRQCADNTFLRSRTDARAYATLLVGLDRPSLRGYFYSALVLARALQDLGLTEPAHAAPVGRRTRPVFVAVVVGFLARADAALLRARTISRTPPLYARTPLD